MEYNSENKLIFQPEWLTLSVFLYSFGFNFKKIEFPAV